MDDRQRQIKEGAGLDESRLNLEFINWLRVWGPRFLTVVLVVLAIYVGWIQYNRYRKSNLDKSFAAYEALASDPQVTPEALLEFARGHTNTPGLVAMTRLMAADLYLNAVRTGIEPGSSPTPDGSYLDTDLLSPARRDELLGKAQAAFEQTLSQAKAKDGLELHAINALFGLAAVDETRGDWAGAEAHLNEAKSICEAARYDALAVVAAGRIARLPELRTPPRLYSQSELPKPVEPPPPAPAPEGPAADPDAGVSPPEGDQPAAEPAPAEPISGEPDPAQPDPQPPTGEPSPAPPGL